MSLSEAKRWEHVVMAVTMCSRSVCPAEVVGSGSAVEVVEENEAEIESE